jgi:hypothetical protein
MSKQSQRISGNQQAFNFKVTGEPLVEPSKGPSVQNSFITSLKVPTLVPRSFSQEESPENPTGLTKFSTLQSGIPEKEPVIIAMSEFIPLFEEEKLTSQGSALSLKENSKILTAKTAVSLLVQDESAKSAVQDNKDSLLLSINGNQSSTSTTWSDVGRLNVMIRQLNETRRTHDISTYYLLNNEGVAIDRIGSFYEILKRAGYGSGQINKFSRTKLWLQSLVEIKRALFSHSGELILGYLSQRPQPASTNQILNDTNPFLLSDVDNSTPWSPRYWINPFREVQNLPTISQITDITTLKDNIIDYSVYQFVELTRVNDANGSVDKFAQDSILKWDSKSGRDIAILANLLFKESTYSTQLKKLSTDLSNKFGYNLSNSGENHRIWDSLIGIIPKSIFNTITATGNDNSLCKFSQSLKSVEGGDSNQINQILTFEDGYLSGSTPGSFYYIDSALSTADGEVLDTTRLDEFIVKVDSAYDTTKTIISLLGYEESTSWPPEILPWRDGERGLSKASALSNDYPHLTLPELVSRLSIVSKTYQPGIIERETVDGTLVPDSLDCRKIFDGNQGAQDIRMASLLCNCIVNPSAGYAAQSSKIKSLLFLLMMNQTLQLPFRRTLIRSQSGAGNQDVIQRLKELISYEISFVQSNITPEDASSAIDRGKSIEITLVSQGTIDNSNSATLARALAPLMSEKLFSRDNALWSIVVDLLNKAMESDIYVAKIQDNSTQQPTNYSGVPKLIYLYNYFDLILRIVSSQVPEKIAGVASAVTVEFSDTFFLSISNTTTADLEYAYDYRDNYSPRVLTSALRILRREEESVVEQVALIKDYLKRLSSSLNYFKNFIKNDRDSPQTYLNKISSLYNSDTTITPQQKNALINLSFAEEQVRMTSYVASEMIDRMSESSDSYAKLKSTSWFKTFPSGYENFLNVDETDLISYSMLSPYFNSNLLTSKRGIKKKIMSIGVTPGLIRNIRSTPSTFLDKDKIASQLVRIKVWLIDSFRPETIYRPLTYLFDMNRFPTRILKNWNYETFSKNDTNVFNVPSKLVVPGGIFQAGALGERPHVLLHRDFSEAFPDYLYGNVKLSDSDRQEIYANHSRSFLIEEYLRWFTDCRFNETRYYRYAMSPPLTRIENQYTKFLSMTTASTGSVGSISSATAPSTPGAVALFDDPTSGRSFSIPVKNNSVSAGVVGNVNKSQDISGRQVSKTKTYEIPMSNTMRNFFRNETFFSDPDDYVKRVFYPKKFDRVFNVIVSPDEFYVDVDKTESSAIDVTRHDKFEFNGRTEYRRKDSAPGDASMNEYFVTIEPFDYQEG